MFDKKAFLRDIDQGLAKIRKNPKLGMDILIEAGIYTKKGNLTKKFR